jgi:hypothetical protein
MAVTVTESVISALNTITTVTSNAATAEVDNTGEAFTIDITRPGNKVAIIIGGTGSAADGDMTYSIAAGGHWAGEAITGTVTKNTEKMIQVDTAKVTSTSGTIVVTLSPAATDNLKTNHAAYMKVIELL